ncbi:MAG: hypothetical protein U0X71_03800 [Sphingobacteriaceae bacterium]|nr:MAG: acyl-protein synthase [Pedobacter sp.]
MKQLYTSKKLAAVQQLYTLEAPYQSSRSNNDLFISAMAEITTWHYERNPFYRSLLNSRGYNPKNINNQSSLAELPVIHANFFKKHSIWSIKDESIKHIFTSSGTLGQKSQMAYDHASITAPFLMLNRYVSNLGWHTPNQACNYLLLSYQPTSENQTIGTSYTDHILCKYAPINKLTYALKLTGDGHAFDPFGSIQALLDYAQEGLPVRIFGFPAFLFFILDSMKKRGIAPIKLHPDSLVYLGGGWKNHADKQIHKISFYQEITKQLGISDLRIRDMFGSVEHCVPYTECSNHHFHIPVWAQVNILDLKTLKPLAYGQEGFLNLQSPYSTSAPVHNILMSDLAVMHAGQSCGCGISSDYFEIIGRASTKKNRSCAVAASEFIYPN